MRWSLKAVVASKFACEHTGFSLHFFLGELLSLALVLNTNENETQESKGTNT